MTSSAFIVILIFLIFKLISGPADTKTPRQEKVCDKCPVCAAVKKLVIMKRAVSLQVAAPAGA